MKYLVPFITLISLVGIHVGWSQTAGPAPTGSINVSGAVTADGGKVVPVNGDISLTASASDSDCDASQAITADTFAAGGAYEWSERNNKGTFSSPNGSTTTYTAPADAGNIEIVLKVKDDGTPYQDFSSATEVASQNLKSVFPDGYTFTASRTGFAENYIAGRLDFQVTYKGVNLPWVGNLAERLGFAPYGFDKVWALPWAWYAQAPSGYWITSGNFALTTDSSGQLSDYHSTSCGPTGPSPSPTPLTTGKFRDASTSQEIGFVKPTTGATISLGTHGIEEYSYFTTAVDGVFQKH